MIYCIFTFVGLVLFNGTAPVMLDSINCSDPVVADRLMESAVKAGVEMWDPSMLGPEVSSYYIYPIDAVLPAPAYNYSNSTEEVYVEHSTELSVLPTKRYDTCKAENPFFRPHIPINFNDSYVDYIDEIKASDAEQEEEMFGASEETQRPAAKEVTPNHDVIRRYPIISAIMMTLIAIEVVISAVVLTTLCVCCCCGDDCLYRFIRLMDQLNDYVDEINDEIDLDAELEAFVFRESKPETEEQVPQDDVWPKVVETVNSFDQFLDVVFDNFIASQKTEEDTIDDVWKMFRSFETEQPKLTGKEPWVLSFKVPEAEVVEDFCDCVAELQPEDDGWSDFATAEAAVPREQVKESDC